MRAAAVCLFLLAPVAQEERRPGLIGEYFNVGHEATDFPYLPADKKPFLRRVDAQVAWDASAAEFAECGVADHFYVRWTGSLRVRVEGAYVFFLNSDDGSALWIDGKRVIDNGGLHAMEEKSGRVELKEGDHALKVEFFENDDKAGVILSWEPPGRPREIVPAPAFFHRRDGDLDKE